MSNSPEINTIFSMKVKHKVTNFIYPNLLTTLLLLVIAGSILFYKFYGHINISKTNLIIWYAVLLISVACQGALGLWFQKTKHSLKWDYLYSKLFIANAGLIGLLWGIVGVVFMPEDSVGQSYLIFTLAFIAAGGLVYLTGSYLAGSFYVTGALLPLIATLYFSSFFQSNHELYSNIILLLICYWAFLLAINYYGSKLYEDNFAQSIINKTLNNRLLNATEELEKMNLIARAKEEGIAVSQTPETTTHKTIAQYTDTLTGADTQEILAIKFEQTRAVARRHHQGLAVFYVDITNFNNVKTKFGEGVANLLLKTASIRLQYCKRDTDVLSRADDNKFILIFSEVLLGDEIKSVTNRIFKTFAEDIQIDDKKIQIHANIGISLFPLDGDNLEELIEKSQNALNYLSAENETSQLNFKMYDRKIMTGDHKNKIQNH